jgi:hypothetical protein
MPRAGWRAQASAVAGGSRYRLFRGESALSFRELFECFDGDDDFCSWYTQLLAEAAAPAYFWEHPALCDRTLDAEAEFVLLDAPALAAERADPRAFEARFAAAGDAKVAVFRNLGGDALLLAPCPRGWSGYPHLAAFVRAAPAAQVRALWRETARAFARLAGAEPVWLSTSGLGVPWLHLRFDRFPKYYQHVAYRSPG